jgi:hypothetical protein
MSGEVGLHYALRRLHNGENALGRQLLEIAARHCTDHEVHHVARDLADWSRANLREIAQVAAEHGLRLDDEADEPNRLSALTEALSSMLGRRPEPGLMLLEDLRDLYLMASENSLAWEMLAQHAQAARERDVLALAGRCHPQTLRQIRWTNTMIKTLSPQVLAGM